MDYQRIVELNELRQHYTHYQRMILNPQKMQQATLRGKEELRRRAGRS